MLTVNYLDGYLSQKKVDKNNLQLLGVACLLVATKLEETEVPEVNDLVTLTKSTYTREEILDTEKEILGELNFNLKAPTADWFCEYFCKKDGLTVEDKEYHLAMMLAKLILLNGEIYLLYLPSLASASCLLLSNYITNRCPEWTEDNVIATGYKYSQLSKCVDSLFDLYLEYFHIENAVFRNYTEKKYLQVALILPPDEPPSYVNDEIQMADSSDEDDDYYQTAF